MITDSMKMIKFGPCPHIIFSIVEPVFLPNRLTHPDPEGSLPG
jgi:hypothetical protein